MNVGNDESDASAFASTKLSAPRRVILAGSVVVWTVAAGGPTILWYGRLVSAVFGVNLDARASGFEVVILVVGLLVSLIIVFGATFFAWLLFATRLIAPSAMRVVLGATSQASESERLRWDRLLRFYYGSRYDR